MIEEPGVRFLYPMLLMLLPLVWWLSWLFAGSQRMRSMWRAVCDASLLAYLAPEAVRAGRGRGLLWLLAVLLSLGIVAAAGPSWRSEAFPLVHSTAARVLVLDLSHSMLAEDIRPSRFDRATGAARALLSDDYEGETGLVVFAGAAFVASPLSSDQSTLVAFLNALNPGTMPVDGGRIDLGISAARRLLEASESGRGEILVITDGAEDIEAAVRSALIAGGEGHRVSVLAVGTPQGGLLRNAQGSLLRDESGRYVVSRIRFDELERVARAGRGAIMRVDEGELSYAAVRATLQTMPDLVSDSTSAPEDRVAINGGFWLLWLMLPLALLLFRKNLLWILVLTVSVPWMSNSHAQGRDSIWKHIEHRAFDAYLEGDYQRVVEWSGNPMLLGSAYYRLNDFHRAAELFGQAGSAIAYYNQGNAYAQLHMFAEALLAYERALRLSPDLEDARFNKSIIEQYLEQQASLQSGEADDETTESYGQEAGETQARIGSAGETQAQAQEGEQPGVAGLGASVQAGQPNLDERFDPNEQQLDQFVLQFAGDRETPDPQLIELWLKTLPESSTDLFRNKFARDHQRNTRQSR